MIFPSQPQQLSTFALTLFRYETKVDGKEITVGEYIWTEFKI